MEPVQHDFLEVLTNSGIPEIAEYILNFLDFNDLKNAEGVCKLWRHVIRNGKIWKRHLEKMLYNPTFKKLYRHFDPINSNPHHIDIQTRDPIFFKLACQNVLRDHQRLLYNWMTGAHQEESQEIYVRGETIAFGMNSRYFVIVQLEGEVLVRLREDVTLESQSYGMQEQKLQRSQSGILCGQLNPENILVCGGYRGVVEIWDVRSGKLLKRFREKHANSIDQVNFDNKLLITGSIVQEPYKGRVTIWNIENLSQISLEGEILFPLQKIFGLALDGRYIIVLVGKEPSFEIQVRLRHDPLILLHSMHYRSLSFSGFHCDAGFVAAGSDEGKIRIWDAETGNCKRILLRPSHDTGAFSLRFNSKFLVINNSRGISIWNFKEAVSELLHPYMKLQFCSFQSGANSQPELLHFQMDAFEIVRIQPPLEAVMLSDLPGRYSGKSSIVRHHFLCQ